MAQCTSIVAVFEGKIPKEVKIEDKTANEQLHLIAQLEEDKQAV